MSRHPNIVSLPRFAKLKDYLNMTTFSGDLRELPYAPVREPNSCQPLYQYLQKTSVRASPGLVVLCQVNWIRPTKHTNRRHRLLASQACTFREPFWDIYFRIRGSRYVLQSSLTVTNTPSTTSFSVGCAETMGPYEMDRGEFDPWLPQTNP